MKCRMTFTEADPGFFLGGGAALRNDVTDGEVKDIKANTYIWRKKLHLRGGAHPLHPPPRSAPGLAENSHNLRNWWRFLVISSRNTRFRCSSIISILSRLEWPSLFSQKKFIRWKGRHNFSQVMEQFVYSSGLSRDANDFRSKFRDCSFLERVL